MTTHAPTVYVAGKIYQDGKGRQFRMVEDKGRGFIVEMLQWRIEGCTSRKSESYNFCQQEMNALGLVPLEANDA